MIREPTLVTPIVCSLFAAVAFSLARIERMPEGLKYLFILIGGLLALWAFVTAGDWLINRGVYYLKAVRQGWMAGEIRIATAIGVMRPDQLRVYERVSPSLETIAYLGRGSQPNMFKLHTPMGDVPYTWISTYLDKCEKVYPAFIPQHGMPGNLERDWVQWFTNEMVDKQLAERAAGNEPARWVVEMQDVWAKFGFE